MNPELKFETALKACYGQNEKINSNKEILLFQNGQWQNVDQSYKNLQALFEQTIQEIVSLDSSQINTPFLAVWIRDFNAAKTTKDLQNKKITTIKASDTHIQFSSVKGFEWLSNFYPTLIYDAENQFIYPHVEAAYVAFKAKMAGKSPEEVREFAITMDPKLVKRLGSHLWRWETPEDGKKVIQEMRRLVALKVSQNPLIKTWLTPSVDRLLTFEEFTSDTFWGSGYGAKINDMQSNHLGRIFNEISNELESNSNVQNFTNSALKAKSKKSKNY
ncbi:NADAR family protein [Candidatus Protochlamydia sp. W-9]|uniref:NADAR family protein n=1 Tax=Candidatus Protochlamydia sp. W-9 TaxID=1785087 RepID=UPI00096A775F|nr:NADAR family protein [Candidatus Protochlamydia sp. W-9]